MNESLSDSDDSKRASETNEEYERLTRGDLAFPLDAKKLLAFASELRREAEPFPIRVVEQDYVALRNARELVTDFTDLTAPA